MGTVAASEDAALIAIQAVILQNESGVDTTFGPPPVSDATIGPDTVCVIELWAQQTDSELGGLNCVFADVSYSTGAMDCIAAPSAAPEFRFFANGSCDDESGRVASVGGCGLSYPGPGINPEWVRVATLTVKANQRSAGHAVSAGTASVPSSIAAYGEVPYDQIDFGFTRYFTIRENPGDVDLDGDMDDDDYVSLRDCLAGPDLHVPPARCARALFPAADLTGDGDVDLQDFAVFALSLADAP